MPFTPFHLGPALLIAIILEKRIPLLTFIVANVILDIEPLLVIIYDMRYPLHGYAHTLIGATLIGLTFGYFSKILSKKSTETKRYLIAGALGTNIHVVLDSPLYKDIKPLYPWKYNPIYYPHITSTIYNICLLAFILTLILFLIKGFHK